MMNGRLMPCSPVSLEKGAKFPVFQTRPFLQHRGKGGECPPLPSTIFHLEAVRGITPENSA